MASSSNSIKAKTAYSRKFLWGLMLVTLLVIFALYNIPGGKKYHEYLAEKEQPAAPVAEKKPEIDNRPLASIQQISKDYSSPFKPFNIQHWTNDRGARIYFVQAPEIPMLDIRLVFDAGAARDGKIPGLAGMVNSMLDEGTENYDVDQIAQTLESLGASFSASSHRDMGITQLRTLSGEEWLTPALELFRELVAKPAFPEKNFERIRKLAILGLEYKEQSPEAKIGDALFQNLYLDHNYGILPDGTKESLTALKREDLIDFHQTFYVAKNVVIAMVGDVSLEKAKTIANQISADLPVGAPAPDLAVVDPLTEQKRIHIDHPSTQTHIRVANHGIKRGDPNHFNLYVANEILGGGGFSSILNEEIRQKRGLSYSVYSYFAPMHARGPFIIGLQTKTDSTKEALTVVDDALTKFLSEGPTEEQLIKAKRSIVNSFPLKMGSNGQIVGQLGAIGFYQLPLDYLDTYLNKIKAVTAEDVKAAMNQTLASDRMLTITVGKSQ